MAGAVVQLDSDGDLQVFNYHVEGIEAVAHKVRTRLTTHIGDWVLEASAGLPFLAWLVKDPNLNSIQALVQAELEEIDEVVRVEDLDVTWDKDAEQINITGTVYTEFGQLSVTATPGSSTNSSPSSVLVLTPSPILG